MGSAHTKSNAGGTQSPRTKYSKRRLTKRSRSQSVGRLPSQKSVLQEKPVAPISSPTRPKSLQRPSRSRSKRSVSGSRKGYQSNAMLLSALRNADDKQSSLRRIRAVANSARPSPYGVLYLSKSASQSPYDSPVGSRENSYCTESSSSRSSTGISHGSGHTDPYDDLREGSASRVRFYSCDSPNSVQGSPSSMPRSFRPSYERKYQNGRKRLTSDLQKSRHGQKFKYNYYTSKDVVKKDVSEQICQTILNFVGGEFDHVRLKPAPRHVSQAKNEQWLAKVLARKETLAMLVSFTRSMDISIVYNITPASMSRVLEAEMSRSFSARSMDIENSSVSSFKSSDSMSISPPLNSKKIVESDVVGDECGVQKDESDVVSGGLTSNSCCVISSDVEFEIEVVSADDAAGVRYV